MSSNLIVDHFGEVAQSVERETENLCISGSTPLLTIDNDVWLRLGLVDNIYESILSS